MGIEPTTYRTVQDADAYFAEQLYATDWTGATDADKAKAMLMATRKVDAICFAGEKASLFEARAATTETLTAAEVAAANALQTREWPRDDAADAESFTVTIDATGGTYTLTFNGETTGVIAYDATAATILTALEALASVTAGDVVVTVNALGADAAGPYDITVAGTLLAIRYNTLTSDPASLTGGGTTADVTVLNDNIPDAIFYGVVEESMDVLSGRRPDEAFRNLTLTSDGSGGTRVSHDRSGNAHEHIAAFFSSPTAWKYIRQYVANNNTFDIRRTS
jgi:hypothetical protein